MPLLRSLTAALGVRYANPPHVVLIVIAGRSRQGVVSGFSEGVSSPETESVALYLPVVATILYRSTIL
jgi:hypothetical protein